MITDEKYLVNFWLVSRSMVARSFYYFSTVGTVQCHQTSMSIQIRRKKRRIWCTYLFLTFFSLQNVRPSKTKPKSVLQKKIFFTRTTKFQSWRKRKKKLQSQRRERELSNSCRKSQPGRHDFFPSFQLASYFAPLIWT